MSTDNRVRVNKDLADKLKDAYGDSWKDSAIELLEKSLESGNLISLELSNDERYRYFSHLSGGKGKEHHQALMELELSEQELIALALEKTGKTLKDLVKDAVLSHAKEQISHATRREYQDKSSAGSPEKRLHQAFAELHEQMMDGRYRPRGGKMTISVVAQRARVNYNTAKEWALANQPELL